MKKKLMITCKEATDMLSQKEEGKISYENRLKLWYHLFLCKWCRAFKKQDSLIIKHLHSLDTRDEQQVLSEEEKKSMIEKLKQF